MKSFALAAAAAALFSTAYSATVTLQETPCIQNNTNLETFEIELGKLVVKDLPSVCGLKLLSATDADINAIKCQAYKDAAGTQKGSAEFTFASPALISTNPVQEGSILCTTGDIGEASTLAVVTATATGTGGGSSPTGANATVSTGAPGSQPTGSATGPGAPDETGAAGAIGVSIGAVVGAFAMLML
ncbi:hypothetical protein BU26DRAFT_515365 [Trematosphaeria pertusa]|uniref:GPI anchored cell wall protein n=1 Tax=Trematosphaeria pertusa TaxID=390896 RepID=A0A6A6IR78_9PLEO|nr:uncharacterized protein BU26DRAFT_515365 [Trematosphaeria pertusa]KAF2252971.1 hypothetical protein BU26DRAFT_515365 [Trematosphaeria pertusa]